MSDMETIAASLNDLLATYGVTRDQIADLLGGAADGGPNGDGNYPVTMSNGATALIPSPRRLAALSGDISSAVAAIQPILDAANAARTRAEDARDRAETATARVEGLASQIIPLGTATITTNKVPAPGPNATALQASGETIYAVTLPAGFDANVNGRRFSIIVPDDALGGVVRLSVSGFGVRDVFFAIGQQLRKRWQATFEVNIGGNKFNFVGQTPDGLSFTPIEQKTKGAYAALSSVLGVQFAEPIGGNPNEVYIPNAPLTDSVPFEAIIIATNTADLLITNDKNERRAVVGAFAEVVKAGTIAKFQYSGGYGNFVYVSSRQIPTIGVGETAPEIWSGFNDVIGTHYGNVSQGSNGKPVFAPIVKRIVGRGSSVVTPPDNGRNGAAPIGQEPLTVLAQGLSAAHGPGNSFYADNWAHGGHVQSQAAGQWDEAMAADPDTPVFMLFDGFGMNDMQMAAYNSGQLSPVFYGAPIYYEAEVIARLESGVQYYVATTSPHDNTEKMSYSFGGNSMGWPYAKAAPVALDEIVPPLASSVTPAKDWTGRGILRPGNTRGEHVNELIRNTLRRLHNSPKYRGRVFLLDAEWAWFRYGVEQHTLTELYGPNEIVHPNLLGHQLSYQRCISEFVAASRRGFGDQWCFRGELAG